jgi:hypothetical protein
VLALIALAAALLPGAHLSLSPLSKTQELTIGVQADAKITSFTLSGSVPVNEATVVVEGRDQATATGNMMIPDQAAQGEVIFSNLTDQPMTIPTDTIVTTLAPASNQSVGGKSTAGEKEFIRFATTQSGILRAGVNQTVTLPVRAITLGRKGNLKSGQLQAVEGTLGAQLAVTNPSATRGGSDRSTPLPTDKDRQLLRTKLLAALEQTALREMLANLADGDVLIPGTLELSQVLEEKFEPSSDSPADQVTLNLRLEHRAQVVMAGDLHALASAALDASLPKGFVPVDGSMEIKNVGQPQASGGRNPTWSLRAQRQIRAQIAAHDAIRVSLGQTPQAAAQGMIKALPLAGSPRIALTPAWWPRLPILPMRYSVTIEE